MSPTRQTSDYVAGLMKQRNAIQLPAGKEYLVESRLAPLARQADFGSATVVNKWVQTVTVTCKPDDLQDTAEALTTSETLFFCDATPFRGLAESVIPQLQQSGHSSISIWLAAYSTGQGPYSVATSVLGLPNPPQFLIMVTDLPRAVLTKVKQDFYTQLEVNRGLSAPMLVCYPQCEGANWTISPKLRQKINFTEHNLMSTLPKGGPLHIVSVRNVLICFGLNTKRVILRRVANIMVPGSYLFPGAAETAMGVDLVWECIMSTKGAVHRLEGGAK